MAWQVAHDGGSVGVLEPFSGQGLPVEPSASSSRLQVTWWCCGTVGLESSSAPAAVPGQHHRVSFPRQGSADLCSQLESHRAAPLPWACKGKGKRWSQSCGLWGRTGT